MDNNYIIWICTLLPWIVLIQYLYSESNFVTLYATLLAWATLAWLLYEKNNGNIKVTRNYISTIHATFVLLFFTFSMPAKWLFFVTVGYYIFDGILTCII